MTVSLEILETTLKLPFSSGKGNSKGLTLKKILNVTPFRLWRVAEFNDACRENGKAKLEPLASQKFEVFVFRWVD